MKDDRVLLTNADDVGQLRFGIIVAILALVAAQIVIAAGQGGAVLGGALVDTDAYMRLDRILHLWNSGAWFDPVYPRINPPEGHAQHWTRLFDAILLVGAVAAAPFVGFATGLHWWGVFISPLLHAGTVFLMIWAARPLVGRGLWLVPLLVVTQPALVSAYVIGRPDHHGFELSLFVLFIGCAVRLALHPEDRRYATASALAGSAAMWVSVEALVAVVAVIFALGLCWLAGDRRMATALRRQAAVLVAATAAVLLMEHGPARFFTVEFDRISFAHLMLFAHNLGFWLALERLERHWPDGVATLGRRALAGGVAAAATLLLLGIVEPGFFISPLSGVDPLYQVTRLDRIAEIQPLVTLPFTWQDSVIRPVLFLGLAVGAIPALLWALARCRPERAAWLVLGMLAAAFVVLTLRQARWAAFAEVVLIIPYGLFVGAALGRLSLRLGDKARSVARPLAAVFLCAWMTLPYGLSSRGAQIVPATRFDCSLPAISAWLSRPEGLGASPKRVLAFVDFGPELLYRTPHSVFAIPNHRPQPGYTAGYEILTGSDYAAAETLVRRHGVDLILLCPNPVERAFFTEGQPDGTLWSALAEGRPPAFLHAVPLPPALRSFRLYAVTPAS